MSDTLLTAPAEQSEQDELLDKLDRYRNLIPPPPPAVATRIAGLDREPLAPAATPPDDDDGAMRPEPPDWPQPTAEQAADRALGCLLGLALGEMAGDAQPGRPMTAAALSLAETLLSWDGFDEEDFLTRLQALPAQDRNALDAGTRAALDAYAAGGADAGPGSDGCGALVRLAPLAVAAARDPDMLELLAARQCRLTHPSREALDACRLFAAMLADALSGASASAATRPRLMSLCPRVLFVSAGEWRAKHHGQLTPGLDAVGALEAALWCVSQSTSLRGAVTLATGLGAGSRETAALAGQLAGAVYGASSITEDWLETLDVRARLTLLASDLQQWDNEK